MNYRHTEENINDMFRIFGKLGPCHYLLAVFLSLVLFSSRAVTIYCHKKVGMSSLFFNSFMSNTYPLYDAYIFPRY